ncbi:MAG: hypothetical protein M1831_003800 [Alyxoria varia]|nr:MAG: hypothetical protein M1831_003800 [Alyxoria varia]
MARNQAPRDSPVPHESRARNGRSLSPHSQPSTAPANRRDKKRVQLADKLREMAEHFDNNEHDHYFAQMGAIQCDINLVMCADPIKDGPLPDDPEDIAKAVAEAREGFTRGRQISAEAEGSFAALSGRTYSRFVEAVNDAIETRDEDLTSLFNKYVYTSSDMDRMLQFRTRLAHEEHAHLSRTIRERLIKQVSEKRNRLLKDKEQLDIADSNSLLLNPSQFSLGHPGSPGGAQNRKTRNTRYRPGDVADDYAETGSKRKRRMPADDYENGSPAPHGRALVDSNGTNRGTDFLGRDSRQKLAHAQFEAPLYSIEKLFTDKELSMNMQRAHLSTNEFFERLRRHGAPTKMANGDDTGEDQAEASASDTVNGAPSENITNGHQQPATRSSGRANNNPLTELANTATALNPTATGNPLLPPSMAPNLATAPTDSPNPNTSFASPMPAKDQHQQPPYFPLPAIPPVLPIPSSKQANNSQAPSPPHATEEDIEADMDFIRRGRKHPGYENLLKSSIQGPILGAAGMGAGALVGGAATEPIGANGKHGWNAVDPTTLGAVRGDGANGVGADGGATPMGRQQSGMGLRSGYAMLGEPMSRGNSSRGGVAAGSRAAATNAALAEPMSRSASGAGYG